MKLWSDAVVHWSAIVASHGNLFVGGSAERSIDRGRTTDQVWNTRRSAATGSDRGVAQGGGLYGKGRGKDSWCLSDRVVSIQPECFWHLMSDKRCRSRSNSVVRGCQEGQHIAGSICRTEFRFSIKVVVGRYCVPVK